MRMSNARRINGTMSAPSRSLKRNGLGYGVRKIRRHRGNGDGSDVSNQRRNAKGKPYPEWKKRLIPAEPAAVNTNGVTTG